MTYDRARNQAQANADYFQVPFYLLWHGEEVMLCWDGAWYVERSRSEHSLPKELKDERGACKATS